MSTLAGVGSDALPGADWTIGDSHLFDYWWTQYAGSLERAKQATRFYVIQEGRRGPVKFGIAQDTRMRLRGHMVSNPRELHVVVDLAAPRGLEETLCGVATRERIRGEWFHYRGVVVEIVAALQSLQRTVADFAADGTDLTAEEIYLILREDAEARGLLSEHQHGDPFADFWEQQ